MTRTHVEEAELVDLQRRALLLFTRLDDLTDTLSFRLQESLDPICSLAREVSDAVDALTDYVRTSRMIE